MRAVVVKHPGGREKLEIQEIQRPAPETGEVLIQVAYASCNWSDIQKRAGNYPEPVTYPAILGGEVSGLVEAIGDNVKTIKTNDRVGAITGPHLLGGYADYVTVPEEYVIKVPDSMNLTAAAAFPIVTLTAYHLLRTAYQLRSTETLLIHAIGGGVGLMLTQMAVQIGAKVFGTASSDEKGNAALKFGAARVINRSREDFVEVVMEETGGKGVDLVIDSLGGDILPRSFDALRPFGHLINIGEASGYPNFPIREKLFERSTSMAGFEVLRTVPGSALWRRSVDHVIDQLVAGTLTVPVDAIFPLDQIQQGHEAMESQQIKGKLLFEVSGQ